MKAQASAGRVTCGVVRTSTPVPRPELGRRAWPAALAAGQRQQQQVRGSATGRPGSSSRSGLKAAASAWPGRSPTITTPSRL